MTQVSRFMDELKKRAASELAGLSLPKAEKTVIKNWDFETLALNEVAPAAGIPAVAAGLVKEEDANTVIVVDGKIVYSKLSDSFKDVVIAPITEVADEHLSLVQEHLGKAAPYNANKLAAMNLINLNGGLFIYAPKNTVIEEALSVIYVQQDRSLINRNLIVLGQSAELKLVEAYVNDSKAIINLVTEVVVGDNAKLDHATMERLHADVTAYNSKRVHVQKHGRYDLSHGALSDGNVVTENLIGLVGEGAESEVNVVAIAEKTQKQNVTVMIEHLAPRTIGNIVNHGISQDEAQLVFNGIGKIHKGMKGSNAEQESRVMILSENARADANPLLLIEEYDVMAGHAAGVGKIDEEQIYYMMSRGVTRREAELLIIQGFLMPFVNEISNESVREELTKTIQAKISA
ncbi:MAG: Fe-S cluster assembly protein SufD [Turicibacter sp.]|nr:Fe-S cluster assembly protein SufD [Turicibacter sp.]